jgi:hypothetical protein
VTADNLQGVGYPAVVPDAGYVSANPVGAVLPSQINKLSCGVCESVTGQLSTWTSTLKSSCVQQPTTAGYKCQTVKYDCNVASNSIIFNSAAAAIAGGVSADTKTCCCFCSCGLSGSTYTL